MTDSPGRCSSVGTSGTAVRSGAIALLMRDVLSDPVRLGHGQLRVSLIPREAVGRLGRSVFPNWVVTSGLPELPVRRLEGLMPVRAIEIGRKSPWTNRVRNLIVAKKRGNPIALTEWARGAVTLGWQVAFRCLEDDRCQDG
jgi:hypothetical protein